MNFKNFQGVVSPETYLSITDEYGYDASTIMYGSNLTLHCRCSEATCKSFTSIKWVKHSVKGEESVVETKPFHWNTWHTLTMQMIGTDIFGTYECVVDEIQMKPRIPVLYRMCE